MTFFKHDPRIEWASDEEFYIPDRHDGWKVDFQGQYWTIAFLHDENRWQAWNPDGTRSIEVDPNSAPEFDSILLGLLGPPLWAIEANMIRWAAHSQGWLPAFNDGPPDGDEPDTGTCAGSAAISNLQDGQIFRPCAEDRQVVGYMLTERGDHLAAELAHVLGGDVWADLGRAADRLRWVDDPSAAFWEVLQDSGLWGDVERLMIANVPQTHTFGITDSHPYEVMA